MQGISFNDCVLPCIKLYDDNFGHRFLCAGSHSAYRKFYSLYLAYLEHFKDERALNFKDN